MSDQLIDALVGVLSSLVGGDQFGVEGPDALPPLGERGPQPRIFSAEPVVRFGQRSDRALESIKVTGFRGCPGNEETPRSAAILPRNDGIRQAIVEQRSGESGEPEDGRRPRSNCVAISQTKFGIAERSVHQFAKSIGVIGKESVDPGFEAPA